MTNPIPQGTTYSVLLPWVDLRCTNTDVGRHFCEWGNILKIDMIQKRGFVGKPEHYKVFIHFGQCNPVHHLVFNHLNTGAEIKVNHQHGYWKVRKSTWSQPKLGFELVPLNQSTYTKRMNQCRPPPLSASSSPMRVPPPSPIFSPESPMYSPGTPITSDDEYDKLEQGQSWGDIE
jgi:hypothetical protein